MPRARMAAWQRRALDPRASLSSSSHHAFASADSPKAAAARPARQWWRRRHLVRKPRDVAAAAPPGINNGKTFWYNRAEGRRINRRRISTRIWRRNITPCARGACFSRDNDGNAYPYIPPCMVGKVSRASCICVLWPGAHGPLIYFTCILTQYILGTCMRRQPSAV